MKKQNKKDIWVVMMGLSLLILLQTSYAFEYGPPKNAKFIITKSDINPLPAEPGKDLLLEVLIENQGQSEAKNVSIEIKPDLYILLKNEDERITYKESLCTFCRLSKTYHLHVDSLAVSGIYEIEIRAISGDGTTAGIIKTINVTVIGKPQLTISDVKIEPDIITPESNFTLDFSVANKGTGIASAIDVKTILDDVPFIPTGVNSRIIEKLNPNSSKKLQYNLFVKKLTEPDSYLLPIQLNYEDENNKNFSSKEMVGVKVAGEAKLSIANIKTTPLIGEVNEEITLTIRIENAGNGDAKSVKASILELPASGVKEAFLGKIEPNDDSPAVFTLMPSKSGEFNYSLLISYEDDIGNHNATENLKLVVKGNNRDGVLKILLPIVLIALVTIGSYFYLKQKKRNEK